MCDMYDWETRGVPSVMKFGDDFPTMNYEDERWKDTELPNICVSDYGRFYNTRTNKFVEPTHGDGQGHKAVKVGVNGKHYQAYAHRLIAKAFIPNPNNYPLVRHLDDEKDNNEIGNLAWGTQSDNLRDALENGRTFTASPEVRDKSLDWCRKPVKVIRESDGKELYFRSVNDAARGTGAQQANVCKALAGTRPRAMGNKYEYISKEEYYANS